MAHGRSDEPDYEYGFWEQRVLSERTQIWIGGSHCNFGAMPRISPEGRRGICPSLVRLDAATIAVKASSKQSGQWSEHKYGKR
jgi:hypothetical protein